MKDARRRRVMLLALAVVVYAAFAYFFARSLGEYAEALRRHFPFLERWFRGG